MGVYAITGASSGIGAKTKELLLQKGHEVINIDLKDGDICVNLATPEGRQAAVDKLHELHPEGLDGMICNAGVSGACGNLELIISLNYFGTVHYYKFISIPFLCEFYRIKCNILRIISYVPRSSGG
ncbi:3-oxoacyl-[acyl-carrier protein] reductase [Clostridium sp. CAG:91]|nr:3-oxoacyl-[acyl-carrier protein] reductase [Clostridium sp. CAG:91]